MDREPKRILIILVLIIIAFLTLIVYLTWFQLFKAEEVKVNSYNKRLWINEEKILRGSIYDRNGNVLAKNIREEGEETSKRVYEYDYLYSHLIGYSYREYGKSALELKYNSTLLGEDYSSSIKDLMEEEKVGNSINLTIDHNIQAKSRELLSGHKGSIITMNPKTGEIYSMVSLPDYNVNTLRDNWQDLTENMESPLLNRATQGLYQPGSTFKTVVASALEKNPEINQSFQCEGTVLIDGYTFKDYNPKNSHGNIGLEEALTKSCNTYFTSKAVDLGKDKLGKTAEDFYINKDIPFDLPVIKSKFDYKGNMGKTEIAASGIGQGKVLMTPLNMALITSTIANNGDMVEPRLVNEILSKDGKVLNKIEPKLISSPLDLQQANNLKDMMVSVVESGTGKNASIPGIKVGGKTGTAENPSGKSHAWFTGFAPAEDPEIVVLVLIEEAGKTGGTIAAPIARELIKYSLEVVK